VPGLARRLFSYIPVTLSGSTSLFVAVRLCSLVSGLPEGVAGPHSTVGNFGWLAKDAPPGTELLLGSSRSLYANFTADALCISSLSYK